MNAPLKAMPLSDLRSLCADMGCSTFKLDQANADRAERIRALGKAREARDAMRLARRCLKDIDQIRWWSDWEEALADARDELRHWLGVMRREA